MCGCFKILPGFLHFLISVDNEVDLADAYAVMTVGS